MPAGAPPQGTLDSLLGDEVTDPGSDIAEVVYGVKDGIVTTVAVVAGVGGVAFVIAGWTPLVPSVFRLIPDFQWSVAFTGVAFLVGDLLRGVA